jgi:hypothetical protein
MGKFGGKRAKKWRKLEKKCEFFAEIGVKKKENAKKKQIENSKKKHSSKKRILHIKPLKMAHK